MKFSNINRQSPSLQMSGIAWDDTGPTSYSKYFQSIWALPPGGRVKKNQDMVNKFI